MYAACRHTTTFFSHLPVYFCACCCYCVKNGCSKVPESNDRSKRGLLQSFIARTNEQFVPQCSMQTRPLHVVGGLNFGGLGLEHM